MTQPLVSVSMITYNHAPFIRQAIEGALQQKTNFPFELVIGEDCSTDGTRETVFDYQKKHPDIIRIVTSDMNVGMKKNGLRTLKACRGKYIAFCEGDDYWHNPHKLQKQADHLESHPECGLVFSSFDVYHVKSKKRIPDFQRYKNRIMQDSPTIVDVVEGRVTPLTCTVMARHQLCEEIIAADSYLHQSAYFQMGDTQLWAEMATRAVLHYIPDSTATHNITEESATRSTNVVKALLFSVSNAELHLYLCNKYNLPQWLKDKYRNYLDRCSLHLAFHSKNRKLALDVRARKSAPFKIKDWILYYGAMHLVLYYPFRSAAFLRRVVSREHNRWL